MLEEKWSPLSWEIMSDSEAPECIEDFLFCPLGNSRSQIFFLWGTNLPPSLSGNGTPEQLSYSAMILWLLRLIWGLKVVPSSTITDFFTIMSFFWKSFQLVWKRLNLRCTVLTSFLVIQNSLSSTKKPILTALSTAYSSALFLLSSS